MPEGEQQGGARQGSYYAWSTLRILAVAAVLAGVVLRFAFDQGDVGTYLLAAGVLVAAVDDALRGELALGVMVAALAVMVVAGRAQWTTVSDVAGVVVLGAAGFALYRWSRSKRTEPSSRLAGRKK